jgi:hypothetical protein
VNFPGCGHNYIVAARDRAAKTVLDFIEAVDRLTPQHPLIPANAGTQAGRRCEIESLARLSLAAGKKF